MILDVLPEAQDDMVVVALWYENQSQGLGKRFIDAVDKTLSIISNSALIYPIKRKGCRARQA